MYSVDRKRQLQSTVKPNLSKDRRRRNEICPSDRRTVAPRSSPVRHPLAMINFPLCRSARRGALLAGAACVHVGSGQGLQRKSKQLIRARRARAAGVLFAAQGGRCSRCEALTLHMRCSYAGQVHLRISPCLLSVLWRAMTALSRRRPRGSYGHTCMAGRKVLL